MHAEAMDWLRRVKPLLGRRDLVCDLGSYDVNGGAREVYAPDAVLYIGVDVRVGRGVDVVADAASWSLGPFFDLVVCTECLEHAVNAADICANAHRLLKPSGIFLVTVAGVERGEHSMDGDDLPEGEFYRNVSESDLRTWLKDFSVVMVQDRGGIDIYALAIKG